MIELGFPVLGESLPVDHGYLLYSALCKELPLLHNNGNGLAIGPISGVRRNGAELALARHSVLRLRLLPDDIANVLPLTGKLLEIGGHNVRLGVPTVQPLVAAPALEARMVTIKGFMQPDAFVDAARRQLGERGVSGEPGIPLVGDGPRRGEPRRKIIRIRDKKVVGFALQVTGLTAVESLTLQERGLGGRRRMGCGFFVPLRPRRV
jgi:CRISPR-associated protein Cas6